MNKNIFNPNLEIYLNYGYLMFPINLNIVSKIKINSSNYYSKDGYHVSLIYLNTLSKTAQKKVLDFSKKFPIKLKKISNYFRLAKYNNLESIIVRVQLQGLKKMITAINNQFGYNFVYPPTHITLFTLKGMNGGIGINSIKEYKNLTHQIDQNGSQISKKSFKQI